MNSNCKVRGSCLEQVIQGSHIVLSFDYLQFHMKLSRGLWAMDLNLIRPSLENAPSAVTSATDVDKEEDKYL